MCVYVVATLDEYIFVGTSGGALHKYRWNETADGKVRVCVHQLRQFVYNKVTMCLATV